ncbi:MAG: hypothetical protein HY692_01225, partial [Cyanobacteria bacterium NC_groundwater_1444_Ag_S-0.65um_54_12]|nr:hypothetical protein [Cyanobacteria bacterium NC_groundwater_1444_Ag_S-0.65um_54_12]
AAADLALPVRLVGLVAASDNMPGSAALKPGDILRSYAGLTVEVINTDAEGRLVLADSLAYGIERFAPRAVIDLATLTGSIHVALAEEATGLFGTDERLASLLREAGESVGERVWRMPIWPEHLEQVISDLADLKNEGARGESDASAAAAFLRRFVGEVPWAHLDIAGTSWCKEGKPYIPKGATGVGVRLVIEALRRGL